MGGRKKKKRGKSPAFGIGDPLLDAIPTATLDLHGDHADAAARRVRDFIVAQARVSRGAVVHIITGRGGGRRGGPVLPGVVKGLLSGDLARFVQEFDRDLDDGGFLVRLR